MHARGCKEENELIEHVRTYKGHPIRIVERGGKRWYLAKDIADILGYGETENMTRRLEKDMLGKLKARSIGNPYQRFGNNDRTIISESGLFNAILESQKTEADDFKEWITRDVLPDFSRWRIRHGEARVFNSVEEIDNAGYKPTEFIGYVYAIEFGDKVKIGCSANLHKRMVSLQNLAKNYCDCEAGRILVSPAHTNYAENEIILHEIFQDARFFNGELFNATIEEVLEAFERLKFKDERISLKSRTQNVFQTLKALVTSDYSDMNSDEDANDTLNVLPANKKNAIFVYADTMNICGSGTLSKCTKVGEYSVCRLKEIEADTDREIIVFARTVNVHGNKDSAQLVGESGLSDTINTNIGEEK